MREHIRAIFLFMSATGPARQPADRPISYAERAIHRAAGPAPRQSMATLVRNLA